MTAPATPTIPSTYKSPADGGRPVSPEALISDEFMHEVVEGYEKGLPDPNDPNDTEQVPAREPGAPAPKAEAPAAEPKADAKPGEPEPKAEEPAPPPKLATEFQLFDKDGEELDVSDVLDKVAMVGVPYRGEVRKMPLDKVVRLAQSGFHNEKLYTDATEAIQSFTALEQDFARASDGITRQNAFIERLLTDEGALQQAREKLAQFHTPEARAERAERRLKELEEARAKGVTQTDATSFVTNDVQPSLKKLLADFPSLTPEEVWGKFQFGTAHLGDVILPKDFDAVRSFLRDDLPAWAAGLHEAREAAGTAVRQAKESNTLLKKRVANAARPTGRVATASDGKAPKKPARPGTDQAIEDLVSEALAGADNE